LVLDIPSVPKDKLSIKVEKGILRVSADFDSKKEEKGEKYVWIERNSGSVTRSIKLPGNVDISKIEASCKDGVCTLKIPKKQKELEEIHHISVL